MTLLAALARTRDPEQRDITPSQLAWARGDEGSSFDSAVGVRIDRDTALGVSAVWACVSLIADSVATLPVGTYTRTDGVLRPFTPAPAWLDNPNPEQTRVDFLFGTVASLLLDGNAFVYMVRDRKGDVREAWLLDPRWVQVRREFQPDGSLALNYYVMVGKGMQSPVGPFKVTAGPDMFHIMAVQPNSSWPRGIGPLDVARMMFGSGIAGQEMGARYFGHGFNAAGVIEFAGDMTNDQARQIKDDFRVANSGIRKMHLPPVLTGGATYKPIQISPEQAQFIEQRRFSVDEIARWFRVPPHMIGNLEKTSSWGAGIEEQGIGFVRYTLRPWLERIEEAWTRHMLTFQAGAFFRFDVSGLMRGNLTAQADYYQKMFMVGGLSPNEIRNDQDLPPFDGGDDHYFAVNTIAIGEEPLKIVKVQTEEPNLKKPLTGEETTAPVDNSRSNGHRNGHPSKFNVDITVEPTPVTVQPTPVTVEAPTVIVRTNQPRRTRKTVTFADGREAVITEQDVP